ncbi:acidic leucine-rich nuclear phosphoprotein 32 family member E-like isoform X1 [Clinocottus analis]|uniref:acidic leucine-rich nuclear phosphoprotein 32 family member E-like isoform X1 n=1 Tax=Clinocottus analis TaxID=304258 RepID=UPI0035C19040
MDMKKRISLELRDRNPAEVQQLVLDHSLCAVGQLEALSDFSSLQELSLVGVGLSSLSNMPSLPKLHTLSAGGNLLSGGLDSLNEKCPNLKTLNLKDNKIKELSSIQTLQNLKNLRSLDLRGCEVSALPGYRDAIFTLLPALSRLDGAQQDPEEQDSEGEPDDDEEAGPPEDDDDDDDNDDVDEDDSSEGEEDEVGLSYLMKEGIQDEEDDGDYVEEEDEEEEEEEEEEDGDVQGEKRKREAEDDGDDDDDE